MAATKPRLLTGPIYSRETQMDESVAASRKVRGGWIIVAHQRPTPTTPGSMARPKVPGDPSVSWRSLHKFHKCAHNESFADRRRRQLGKGKVVGM
ncbi:rho guanine nucleotide exchange factor 17 [Anopheles sinensis]|uniref:Rho guanine nucleotide exchange factor 17 n=1 Tax=Anopheles sinensis TaxID=74873 RepID=A0A084WIK2_ANOSI|nr:rho guanine nucleotide exchange factor 17 [Anopheles sinensis]